MLRSTRGAVCRWLEEVLNQSLEPAGARRLARILGWLRSAPAPKPDDAGTGLSTDAFAQLRTSAGAILAGRTFVWPLDPSYLTASGYLAFNRWSVALTALVSGTIGLGRQSLALIEVDDWQEFQPGHFWLCWKHDNSKGDAGQQADQRLDDELTQEMYGPDRHAARSECGRSASPARAQLTYPQIL